MSLDLESLGGGFGTGLIGTILGVLGITRRMNKLEENKQEKSVCEIIHKSANEKFEAIIKGQERLFEKVDDLNSYLRNRRE